MTDAMWDDDDQRKIHSSSRLHKKRLPSHHLHLAFRSVLETVVSLAQPEVDLLASNCRPGWHSHVAQLQPLRRGPLPLRKEAKQRFSANVFISMNIKQERWKPLTFFLRPAATSTVGTELPPRNKLRFQCRVSNGIDCGALGRMLKRRKLRQRWANDGLAGEAAERDSVLASASQKSLPCNTCQLARALERNTTLTYFAKPPGLLLDCCLETKI
jgi:hypothetical protein